VSVQALSGHEEVPTSAFELQVTPASDTVALEKGRVFVSLSSKRDDDLVAEGLVRDLARRLQALRKKKGFVPTEVLRSAAIAGLEPDELAQLGKMKEEIAFLVRVRKVELRGEKTSDREWTEDDLDGRQVFLDVG
jgi:isoleucyl-tRNA synthetase